MSTEFHAGWTEVSIYDSANEDWQCLGSGLGTGQVSFHFGLYLLSWIALSNFCSKIPILFSLDAGEVSGKCPCL